MLLFPLLAGASLFIHLISSVLTCASSPVLLSNSPWKQERGEKQEKSSASPEQRRPSSRYRWYGGVLSTYFHIAWWYNPVWIILLPSASVMCGCRMNDFLQVQQQIYTCVKSVRETAERALLTDCTQQDADSRGVKPLLPSTGGTVLEREPVREAGPANRQTTAFVPLPSQQVCTGLC